MEEGDYLYFSRQDCIYQHSFTVPNGTAQISFCVYSRTLFLPKEGGYIQTIYWIQSLVCAVPQTIPWVVLGELQMLLAQTKASQNETGWSIASQQLFVLGSALAVIFLLPCSWCSAELPAGLKLPHSYVHLSVLRSHKVFCGAVHSLDWFQ